MTLPFPQPILCPVLIGRVPQLDTLRQLIDAAKAGQMQMALIAGETGVGKSRLVAEAKAYAVTHGYVLLQGACFPQDSGCPYAPLIDLLRARFASSTPAAVAAEVAPFTAELSPLIPDLLPRPIEPLMPPAHDPEQQRRRLFDALTHSLVRRFAPQPTLLIVEDLHWADDGSLDFLLYLVRRSAGQPLLLIGTYRSDEIRPSLARWLEQLERERLTPALSLLPFTRDEVAAMMRAIFALPRPVRAEFLDAIFTLSEGNPFTVEELLTSLVAVGDVFYADGLWDRKPMHELRIPRNRREAVQARVMQLSSPARQLLTLASVVGRRFNFALLQHLTQQTEDTIIQLIKELIDAQLVVEESADQFAFRHALTRQAIYTGLLTRERAGLHRAIAEALEQTAAESLEPHVADLADHFFEAGIWERVLDYARLAGVRAQELGAPYAATTYYSRALEATNKLGLVGNPEIVLSRGHAYEIIGDFERAQDDYLQGLDLAHAMSDGIVEWRSLSALGQLWAGRDYAQSGHWYRQGLDHALALGDPTLHAHSLNQLGNWLINTGQASAGLQAHHQALTLFQAQHDQQGMAETRDVLGMACALAGDLVGAAQHYHAAIDLLRALQDQRNLSSSLAVLAIITSPGHAETTANLPATFEHCRASATEALQLARQLDWRAGQSFAEWQIGLAAASFGQFSAALAHATESLHIAREIEHQQWIVGALFTLGATYMRMLAPDAARDALLAGLPLAQALGSTWWIGNITSYLVLADLQQHELARATTALEEVMPLDTLPVHPLHTLAERRVAWAWGELALAQGAPEQALRIAERLLESAPGAADDRPIPSLLQLKGAALLAMQQPDAAAQALEAAQRGAERRGERPLLWQIQRTLGQTYQRLGRRKQAQAAFAVAREIVDTLAATIDMVDVRDHFVRTAGAALPRPRPLTSERAAATRFGSLTARERAVARLIAQGKANQEIADALVLSKRTIETHVGSILAKLQVTTRTQIARWAIAAGLLDDLAEPTP